MNEDLTIVYYTDNSLPSRFAAAVRERLLWSAQKAGHIPIVSISQRPIEFGVNVCLAEIGRSYRSILRQIAVGCLACETEFVALCEHDVLYPPEHFFLRPHMGEVVFDQNRHRALIDCQRFSPDRGGRSMQLVIAQREALLQDMVAKLLRCRRDEDFHGCFEPGKGCEELGIGCIDTELKTAPGPGILDLVNHGGNYAPAKRHSGKLVKRMDPWGTVQEVMQKFYIPGKAG
jgi:hypothetical protein